MNQASPKRLIFLEFFLYGILGAFMLHATWLTWPDVFIDFSRELYLPWRVSCGDVLYRDLAYYFGPVSVYTNAALFAILGRPSIHALFALNFVFWIAILLALRTILRRIASPLATTLAISSFILLFSFSRYTLVGNYNFLAPYSHEITRGFLFALLSLLSLDSAMKKTMLAPSERRLPAKCRVGDFVLACLSGFLFALVLFSKPELALASTASLILLFALHAWGQRPIPLRLRPLLAFSLAAIATLALVVVPFAVALHSLPRALHDTLFKLYLDCFNPDLTSLPFFKGLLGTDHPASNCLRLGMATLLSISPFLLARLILPRLRSARLRLLATVLLSLFAAAIGWFGGFNLHPAFSVAPFALLALALWKRGPCPQAASQISPSPLAASFALFALLLVSKMFLKASVSFYGFVLALPAFCCALLLAFRPPCPPHRVAIASAFLLAILASGLHANVSNLRFHSIQSPVYDGSFLTPAFQARAFNEALSWIRSNTPPDSTLAVLPEGALLNVFADRPNPTPYVSLPITDIPRYDVAALVSAYSNAPPDTLVLVAKLGEPKFGTDYAQDLMAVLDPLYSPAVTFTLPSPGGPIPYLLVARKK